MDFRTIAISAVTICIALLGCSSVGSRSEIALSSAAIQSLVSRTDITFCGDIKAELQIIDSTRAFFPISALAQTTGVEFLDVEELLAAISRAESIEAQLVREFQSESVRAGGLPSSRVIRHDLTERTAGCYVELSSVVRNPYSSSRRSSKGMFVRYFHGGPMGISGSVAYWFDIDLERDGTWSLTQPVQLPIWVN